MTAADAGLSGVSLKKREAFLRLLRDGEAGRFELVVVKDISRFARNTVDALQSIRKLKALGINTLFLTANMDTMGDSEFVLTLFSAMAQEESGNLSKRVKWGKRINAEKGRVPPQIFGYDRMDNFTLRIREEEAAVIRRIFELYCDRGLGCRRVSQELNRRGDRTKQGSLWDPRGVGRILENPLYCGILVNHKYETRDYLTGHQVELPREDHFVHQRPQWAIISRERFQQAQDIRQQRRKKSREPGRYSGRHGFSTLIRCADCGRPFTRKTYTYRNTRIYWRCVTREQYPGEHCANSVTVEEDDLWNTLRQYLKAHLKDPEGLICRVLAAPRPEAQPWEQGKAACLALERKKERYRELYAAELLSLETLREKLERIDREEGALVSRETSMPREARYQLVKNLLDMVGWNHKDLEMLVEGVTVESSGQGTIFLRRHDPAN